MVSITRSRGRGSRKLPYLLASTALVMLPNLAGAQAASTGGVEEVVVTAERRSENVERVPVSVAVLSADALAKRNITTEADLPFAVPGLTVRVGATANEQNYAIRGQSVDQYSGASPGVLPYINDVQISNNTGGGAGATAFYDLQSVQVLKGPQGTLFGRNATGGAVLFTTQKPTDDFGGYVSALAGNYDTYQFQGALNVPLVDDELLARVAGFYQHQDGYQHNLYDNSHPGTGEREGVRGSFTFKPTSKLENDFVIDYFHTDGTATQSVLYNLMSLAGAAPAAFLYSPALGPGWTAYLASHTNPTVNPLGLTAFFTDQKHRGPYTIATNDRNVYTATNTIVTNTTTYDIGADTQLKNIFGFAHLSSLTAGDSDGSPYGVAGDGDPNNLDAGSHDRTTIYSDELQLLGKAFGDNLTYAAGVYFSDAKANVRRITNFFDILGVPDGTNHSINQNTTYAIYGQGTYDLSDATGIQGLSVTAGLRYNNEKVKRTTLPDDETYGDEAANPPGVYSNFQSKTFDNVSWTVGLQEQLNPNLLFYITSRRSYRNGGFNANLAPLNGYADIGGDEYLTEQVTDIEGGVKYSGDIGGVPAQVNFATYNTWIDNSQRTAFASVAGNPSAITVNVPKSEDYGFEFDGEILPVDWLNLGTTINYVNARFTKQDAIVFGTPSKFATVPDTPEWSGTVYGEITVPVANSISAVFRADAYAQTKTYFSSSAQINTGAKLPGYGIANFQIGLEGDDIDWSLTANLKNAFDQTYYVGGIGLGQLLDYNVALPGMPRTFTVEARYKF